MAQVALMLNISERLTIAYRLKEQFYNVMASRSKHEITANISHLANTGYASKFPEFNRCADTFSKWYKSIILGLLSGYTNGFIEGCNNRTKVLKRIASGFRTFDHFRNRLLCIAHHTGR